MNLPIYGQKRAELVLSKLFQNHFQARTIIFSGSQGVGKYAAALELSGSLLGQNPFLSSDFQSFRNDRYLLKTRYFLQAFSHQQKNPAFSRYFWTLLSRMGQSVFLDENSGKKSLFSETREKLESILLSERFDELITISEELEEVSLFLSKRKKIPIDFIRSSIDFHSVSPSGRYKITLIGNFDDSTPEAQNAALKLFEEPPQSSLILLTCSEKERILPTIRSRSIDVRFDRLNSESIKEIFGQNLHHFKNTVDYMENEVFDTKQKSREMLKKFLSDVAPRIQHSSAVFEFCDELLDTDAGNFPVRFLEEIQTFFRELHLGRQSYIRGENFQPFLSDVYRVEIFALSGQTFTNEIQSYFLEIERIREGIRFQNITPKSVFPSLLIDLARWYQQRTRSH